MMDIDIEEDNDDLTPRPYQIELEEVASNKNTIIHLPTGAGKTYIAIRLIKRLRKDFKKPWGRGGKRTFFLVNTVPLVNQQRVVINRAVPKVVGYSGEDGVDYWDKSKWDAELEKYHVIVMTSQILADMITHSYIRIEDINLLVFDECHHAVVDHPMRLVMKHFESCPYYNQPRVLGLTATLLNSNVPTWKIEETLRELETTFHATIATVNELGEVLNYSTNPHEVVKVYTPAIGTPAAREAIEDLIKLGALVMAVKLPRPSGNPDIKLERGQRDISTDPDKIIKEVKNMTNSMILFINELGVYGGAIGILAYTVLLERLKRKAISIEEERLYKFTITHSIQARLILLKSMEKSTGYEKIIKHSSEKVKLLLNVLKEYSPTTYEKPGALLQYNIARKPLSAIIFTQQRFTSLILYNLLKDVKEANPVEFGFLNHDFIVGFNVNPFKCTREQYYKKKTSQKALLKFGNKEINCLISTSVIEEGVDIPQCLLVLRYDRPLEYRSYIQSKGRARSSDSTYVVLVGADVSDKYLKSYSGFQQTERYIQKLLVGKSEDRDAPTEYDIQEGLYDDDEIPPYVTQHGARLSAVSAISLLNRYCSVLPHDQFTLISPVWIKEYVDDVKQGQKTVIRIMMPIACPVKDVIVGMPLKHLKSAKRSAALNACKRLHEEGELDEITLLPRYYGTVDFEQPDVRSCFPNWPWDNDEDEEEDLPKAGTKKRVRKHKKVFPAYLQGLEKWKSGTTTFYLHVITLKTVFQTPKDSRELALYDLLQQDNGFGFLTTQKLPKLCQFPMFLTAGEVRTSLEMNYAVIDLNKQLFDLVKRFHFFVFDQVLEVAKKFTVFEGTSNCLYVVPIKASSGYDIDWETMQTHQEIRPITVPNYEERRSIDVTEQTYLNHVVTPWYRGTILPDRYIVTKVLEHMTPKSFFEANTYGTYADYYANKYNLEIFGNEKQPLLEVRNISTRMNCLMPRASTMKELTDKQQKLISQAQGDDKPKGFPEIFIPEFCIKYDFPGELWYKAIMLPSIVHRVTMLLTAYELRAEITRSTRYGQVHLTRVDEEWAPIEVNLQVAMKSMLSLIEDPAPVTTIDRINNPIDDEAPRPLNIVSMKESIYQLQTKKLAKEYPWDEKSEPIDIERNLSTVTVVDIECYDEFVSALMRVPTEPLPPRVNHMPAAILPPPAKYIEKIQILSRKPSARGPELKDILAALTTIKSNDAFNLERVETLGDSFLKFASSLYLYHKFPQLNEGQLTNIKCRLLGNRNLYYAGANKNLGGRMKVEQFAPRKDFLVPGFFAPKQIEEFITANNIRPTFLIGMQFSQSESLSGQLSEESLEAVRLRYADSDSTAEREPVGGAQNSMQCYVHAQAVSDKCIADCVEGLIGTYLLSDGILAAVKTLEWLKVLPPQDNFTAFLKKKVPTVVTENKVTEEEVDRIMSYCKDDIEEILNYKFKDASFILEALSHSSFIRNRITRSYERLEFLGDAILDFLITAYIFENCGDLKPGELTDLRSALVNNVTFASYVVKLGLYKFICYQMNPILERAIMQFVEHQERRDHQIVPDVLYLIDEEDCRIAEYVEVPKVLSDVFESLIGAVYLDSGSDLQAVWSVVYRIMHNEIDSFSKSIPLQPVRVLYEKIHACPSFGTPIPVPKTNIPRIMIPVSFTMNGRVNTVYGCGANKFQAKRAAAKLALKMLGLY